jgi:hypothetical protein
VSNTKTDPRQTLAEGFAAGKITLDEFTAGLAALATGAAPAATGPRTAQTDPSRRAQIRVEPSDDYKFGHVSLLKVTPSGTVRSRFNLWVDDQEAFESLISEILETADLVREAL